VVSALTVARARIAKAWGAPAQEEEITLGPVTLRASQVEAVDAIRRALDRHGGALLADEPGQGKTYVALAVARRFTRVCVLAPAALRSMWRDAAHRTATPIVFESLERLSRSDAGEPKAADLVIVDEAHHLANPRTRRYRAVATLSARTPVLLLSATPVRNRAADLNALLALFLGRQTAERTAAARAVCVIRRDERPAGAPRIEQSAVLSTPSVRGLASAIRTLPQPFPLADGRAAQAILTLALVRGWASSLAALDRMLQRRVQRGEALASALADGQHPTRRDLAAWICGDDAIQFAVAFDPPATTVPNAEIARATVARHLEGVRAIRMRIAPLIRDDLRRRRAFLLAQSHPTHPTIAFTTFATTAESLWQALRDVPGTVLLTARGARSASGARSREEVLRALGPDAAPRPAHDPIRLVLTTDVLSEGVNLQQVATVVHLDQPWTPAGLAQREGRAARPGSPHTVIRVASIAPPRATHALLAMERRLQRKRSAAAAATSASTETARVTRLVARWHSALRDSGPMPVIAAAHSPGCDGAVAVVRVSGVTRVIGVHGHNGTWRVTTDALDMARLVRALHDAPAAPVPVERVHGIHAAVERWHRQARIGRALGDRVNDGASALSKRLDATLAASPPHTRAHVAAQVAELRARIPQRHSLGWDRLLAELARLPDQPGTWLELCRRQLEGRTNAPEGPEQECQLEALVVLVSQ
jgi:superfamily II DNA or RNA helicase